MAAAAMMRPACCLTWATWDYFGAACHSGLPIMRNERGSQRHDAHFIDLVCRRRFRFSDSRLRYDASRAPTPWSLYSCFAFLATLLVDGDRRCLCRAHRCGFRVREGGTSEGNSRRREQPTGGLGISCSIEQAVSSGLHARPDPLPARERKARSAGERPLWHARLDPSRRLWLPFPAHEKRGTSRCPLLFAAR
jgi:hypothetical protein